MKKILALSLACMLLLALCACGDDADPTTAPTTAPTTTPTTIPTTAPVTMTEEEAKQIASELLGKYAKFGAVPVCCETEYVHADMSAFLTDAQKEIYIGSQHKILCCKSAAEVNSHIDRTMVPALSCNYPDDLLFSDDEGNMYVIIYPTEHNHYENHRVVSFDNSTIVLEADDVELGEIDGTMRVVCVRTAEGFVLSEVEYTPTQKEFTEEDAQQIATRLLDDFTWYNAVGTCCELQYWTGDWSEFLTEEQKDVYMGSQQRIKCCSSADAVRSHIDRTFAKELITGYPDKLLFSDDMGNFYIMIYPSSLDNFGNIRILSYDNTKIEAEADCVDYDETVLYTVRFTCENANPGWMLTKYE